MDVLRTSFHAVHHAIEYIMFREKTRARTAALAVVEEDRVGGALNGAFQVRDILEDDRGRLSAQFQGHFLQVSLRRVDDELADLGRAREGDLVHARMARERRACRFAETGDDIQHAFRHAGLHGEFAEEQRRERRLLGGLEDDGIAGGQRGSQFPRGHQQRKVPWDDLADHAQGLAHRIGEELRPGRVGDADGDGVSLDLRSPARHVVEHIRRQRNIGHPGHAHRLAVVQRFELREFVQVIEDHVADVPENPASLGGRHVTPCALVEGMSGRRHRMIDVLGFALRDLGNRLAGGGIEDAERFARRGIHPFAVDEQLFGPRKKLTNIRGELLQRACW